MILAIDNNLRRLHPVPPIDDAAWQRGVTPEFWRYTVLFNGRLDFRVLAANDAAGWVVLETSRRLNEDGSIVRDTERRPGRVQIRINGRA